MEYIYDGSFDGLLSCFYAHVYTDIADAIITEEDSRQMGLLAERTLIVTDEEKSEKVANAIEKKISPAALRRCYRAFLSCVDGREMDILRYVFLGFKIGANVDMMHGDPIVRKMDLLNHKTSWELERFLGILRFSVVYNENNHEVLYAPFAPNADLIQLMMPHFLNRYRREAFVIHDLKREKAAFSSGGCWVMRPLPKSFAPSVTKDEEAYRNLWKDYFSAASIKERTNHKLQKQFIPRRYWQHLTEMSAAGSLRDTIL